MCHTQLPDSYNHTNNAHYRIGVQTSRWSALGRPISFPRYAHWWYGERKGILGSAPSYSVDVTRVRSKMTDSDGNAHDLVG